MGIGRTILLAIVLAFLAALVYVGWWQFVPLFAWQNPMLTWVPLLVLIAVGFFAGSARLAASGGGAATHLSKASEIAGEQGTAAEGVTNPATGAVDSGPRLAFWFGGGFLAALIVLLLGLWFTLISPPAVGLDEIDYEVVDSLPETTQPRLLPRTGVNDDPRFKDTKEIHLARDPRRGDLIWTGEWLASTFSGPSSGVAVKPLDDLVEPSRIIEGGFAHSVAGITPSNLKGKARLKHPLSRTQYPVLVPTESGEAIAIAPYVGYSGFPFRYPYLKGVLVYHEDGELEDLAPEEAASRPELARSGRIVPEVVARSQAEALSRSDEFKGKIVDGEENRQPYLTAIDEDTTAWVTIINEDTHNGDVKAIVIADSTTGETDVWAAPEGTRIISTEDVVDKARALPLQWEDTRCCDSDGHSYTVTLRRVVEPRLAFKDGKPYYMVTVVPTDELALGREVEYTMLIDAETGKLIDRFDHVAGGVVEDAKLQAFFRS